MKTCKIIDDCCETLNFGVNPSQIGHFKNFAYVYLYKNIREKSRRNVFYSVSSNVDGNKS